MTLRPGTVFAGYTVVRQLGAGGMGAVYLARHPRLPRQDALKVLDPNLGRDRSFRERFEREAELAARLDHPNIVAIFDRGADGDELWISMQYVEGFDAATLVEHGPSALPPQRALHIVGEAAKGLDSAHRQGLLHRDVKPANILIAANSGSVLLTDFGIARSVDSSTSMTGTGSILGTIAYAAPEQIEGGQLDHRVDVYALGCTLYEMLTGSVPFRRETPLAVMHAHLTAPPPRATHANPALPPAIDAVIARALAKRPDDRYPSCRAFADAAAAAFAPAPPPPKRSNRLPILAAVALVLVLMLVATVVTVWLRGRDRSTPEPVAAPTTSATSAPKSTTTQTTQPPPGAWGAANYIVAAFPDLLPKTPNDAGYQGVRCKRVGTQNGSTESWLHCPSDNGFSVNVWCDPAKTPQVYTADEGATDVHEERWTRPSGSGKVRWASSDGYGLLSISFDDASRNFCVLGASGGTSGQDVYDNWFRNAPF